ncbi:putative acyl-CoA:6-aminopenicillanic-acid-acyltransferase [Aspergillus candidus]|uniref:Putative acyl-CoA:6-aminopenicillanic-acid-acyltransferase n=1 Tax=Aspergillus candidus TaxID=41067 RepID=A0A2I2EYB1_ASPCN|nr:putative acyl-CoA:6-aminopenicillanic-acid-acyltransferase [Aspergillus candidus]PLB33369.1 putative acyl-CoA:6-aminopenicillanic-acid-acyltransferase [Aspergillus candidus]
MQLKARGPTKLDLRGSPRKIGFQHGLQLQRQIKDQISVYEEMFDFTSQVTWETVKDYAREFQVTLQRLTPDLYSEMEGIAEGAGLDVLDIVALNCRSELALELYTNVADGCTSVSWKKTENSRLLAQNWDWTSLVSGNIVLMSVEREGKPKVFMVTEAGVVGKIGFNSAGVGVGLNAIKARPCETSKLPIHVALRLCLESTSVDQALSTISKLGGLASAQYIVLADNERSLGLELSPLGDFVLEEDDNGIVTHTNHFIANRSIGDEPWQPDSDTRLRRVQQLCSELMDDGVHGKHATPAILRDRIFSDMYNMPNSICRQADLTRHPTMRSSTLFNIVMNLEPDNLGAEVVIGQPGSGIESSVVTMPWA